MVGPVVSPLANDRLLDPIVARIVAQLPTSVTADIARARIDHEIARIPAGTVEVIAATTPASAARLRQEMSVLDGIGRDGIDFAMREDFRALGAAGQYREF